ARDISQPCAIGGNDSRTSGGRGNRQGNIRTEFDLKPHERLLDKTRGTPPTEAKRCGDERDQGYSDPSSGVSFCRREVFSLAARFVQQFPRVADIPQSLLRVLFKTLLE